MNTHMNIYTKGAEGPTKHKDSHFREKWIRENGKK